MRILYYTVNDFTEAFDIDEVITFRLNKDNTLQIGTHGGAIYVNDEKTAKQIFKVLMKELEPLALEDLTVVYKEEEKEDEQAESKIKDEEKEMLKKQVYDVFVGDFSDLLKFIKNM